MDSALLQELGEHLVGKPYIAVAELVKNSYDADATIVEIELEPENDRIRVSDNGHGMDFTEFKDFWMRIGSVHKREMRISRNFHRPMTGSKGVGRLAVQYLADELTLITISEKDPSIKFEAYVKWSEAIKAEELTEATVHYELKTSEKEEFEKGTHIILTSLKHDWEIKFVRELAKEIWWLQPPFRNPLSVYEGSKQELDIRFESPEKDYVNVFNKQIHTILNIWYAKIIGKNNNGNITLSLEFAGEEPIIQKYFIENCNLVNGNYEIRIFNLYGRQPYGIKVGEARKYFNEFGGVHVYDGSFHLPYYGDPKNDWLKVEVDHSHRLTISKLLPKDFQIDRGLQFLPTLSRILGVVNVDTSKEPDLHLLITRDRLQETEAFANLVKIVRWGLDYYAYEQKKRSLEIQESIAKIEEPKYRRIEQVLDIYKSEIPKETYENVKDDIKKVSAEIETEAEQIAKRVGLMGSLATAGITSLAVQHETRRQFFTIDDILKNLDKIIFFIEDYEVKNKLLKIKKDLSSWIKRVKMSNSLYSYLLDIEDIKIKKRYPARTVIEDVANQVKILLRGIPIDSSKVEYMLLPEASLVEWSSIFQNVFINAFNALLDSEIKIIQVSLSINGRDREILVQDTGCGIDLKDSDTLFEPFVRKLKISPERRALGYGGTGLGLTIVRLIAHNIGCEVSFVEPEEGFNTAFSLRWRECE